MRLIQFVYPGVLPCSTLKASPLCPILACEIPLRFWERGSPTPSLRGLVLKTNRNFATRNWTKWWGFERGTWHYSAIREQSMHYGNIKMGQFTIQYVWGQYAMHNLGANSAWSPVNKFTNFMVGRNPLVIEWVLLHSKSQVASSQGASFFSPKILLNKY
jgi:hypothetical protein